MNTLPKGKTVDAANLQPGELIHIYFDFYNMTSIRGLTSVLTVVYERTRMLWVFNTESKIPPFRTIHFILKTSKN